MIKILIFIITFSNLLFSNNNFSSGKLVSDTLSIQMEIKDKWFAQDKGMHLAGSFMSSGLLILSGNRFLDFKMKKSKMVGISFTFSLALGKELYDSQQPANHFCYKDLTADVLGIVLAILVFK